MMPEPKAVLLDLDNTLVPFLEPLTVWARTWARERAGEADREAVERALLAGTLDGAEDLERGVERVEAAFDLRGDPVRARAIADETYREAVRPYPGVCGMLAELDRREARLGVVTDAPRDRAFERLGAAGLARVFEVIVTRDETPKGKQGPEPFLLALGVLDVDASRAAMLGDWPAYDATWPRRLGMRAVLAGWGRDPDDPRASQDAFACSVAGDPSEVPSILYERDRPHGRRRSSHVRQARLAVE